jgi:hypothetical protein
MSEDVIEFDGLCNFEQQFPMKQYQLETVTKLPVSMVTAGDAIANHVLVVSSLTQKLLKSLEQFLRECSDNHHAHGLSYEMAQALVDRQDELAALVDTCVELSNKVNEES